MYTLTGMFRCLDGHEFDYFVGAICPICNNTIDYGGSNVGLINPELKHTIRQEMVMVAINIIERINVFLHRLL